jgi:dihydrofolate reductase
MSTSLDGFIAGPNEGPGNGLGDGGELLHDWALTGAGAGNDRVLAVVLGGVNGQLVDEFISTGAVVAGRGTFEPAGGWGGDHRDGVPILILTRQQQYSFAADWPLVTPVSDIAAAMATAKEAAGDKNVLVHGAGIAQRALAAGVLDEFELHIVPVLFGAGRRLFEGLAAERIELEPTRILEGEGGITHMHAVRRSRRSPASEELRPRSPVSAQTTSLGDVTAMLRRDIKAGATAVKLPLVAGRRVRLGGAPRRVAATRRSSSPLGSICA